MLKPLKDEVARCRGVGCNNKDICKRHLTIALDSSKTPRYEYRVRSYYQTLQTPSGECKHFKGND